MRFRFQNCELDRRQHRFLRDGAVVPLEPQVFDLLTLFLSHPGELIGRDRIIETVWSGRIVSEAAISSRVNALRRAIGDDGRRQAMLKTVPRRGFRFDIAVERLVEMPAAEAGVSGETQSIRVTRSRDGTHIAYAITGSGPPLLRAGHFLTHLELDWNSPIWRPLLDRLGGRFSVTRYDQRGTGLSDPAPPSLGLDRLVEDLEAVADAAGLAAFPIFAASQGVPVAIAFAARHPERVTHLVLYGGFAKGRRMRGDDAEVENANAILTILRKGWGRTGGAFAMAFTALYMPEANPEQMRHIAELQLASASPENAVALREAIDGYDVSGDLDKLRAPTLILHAREDSVHPVSQASVLAAGIAGARLQVMEGRNHILLPQDPCWEAVMRAIETFCAEAV